MKTTTTILRPFSLLRFATNLCALTVALAVSESLRPACCQTVVEAWSQRYAGPDEGDDFARATVVDGNGNLIVTGYSIGSDEFYHYATIKYSGAGVPLWTNRYSGPGGWHEQPNAIAVDATGNVFVTGFSPASGFGSDFTTVKYSGAGAPLWTNRYSSPEKPFNFANAMVVDSIGDVLVTGFSSGVGIPRDYTTIKYSGAGVPLWTNRYNGPANSEDYAEAIAVDAVGNVFVTGGSGGDFATIKYSGTGVPLWTNRYSSPGRALDYAYSLAVDSTGDVFVTGDSYNGTNSDYAIIKYSGAGLPLWTNYYNGPDNSADSSRAVAVDGSGNVFVTGPSLVSSGSSDYATIAYSGAGVPLWTNRYNGPGNADDFAYSLGVDATGNVYVTGASTGSGSGQDFATIKYSGAGVPLWTNRYNGPANGGDWAVRHCLAVGPNGSVFVTGGSGNLPDTGVYDNSYDFMTIKYVEVWPIELRPPTVTNGVFTCSFTNTPGAPFTLLATTNVDLPVTNWIVLGGAEETSPGQFTVTDLNTTNRSKRFYKVRSP